jgi:hypothetical protein
MTERRKDLLFLAALLVILILMFSKILFTDKIIRAPDIINEFYWWAKAIKDRSFADILNPHLEANWGQYINSGTSTGGGDASVGLLYGFKLIFHFLPAPANIAWFIVLHLFFAAAGVYYYCRTIGCSRAAAFLGGLIFAMAPENASLINAGHVMKIATISFAPWAFFFLERGFQTRRTIFFLTTGFVLAFQFFHTHWQIAYYTCLCVGLYGVVRSALILWQEKQKGTSALVKLLGLNLLVLLFFLSTVSISLLPLTSWSTDTNRGVSSGANAGKGGLQAEEAMMWSMPPEELVTFVIPGFFGLSRQEGGENPTNIPSYYWGRMVFTQTADYMGLLPWLLLPLPLIFRRDRYTWLALLAVFGGILFSMGKYTFFYQFLFDHFPGINRFRVPKMMLFITVGGLSVLAARGLDCFLDKELRQRKAFLNYMIGLALLPVILLILLAAELVGQNFWVNSFIQQLAQPTRFEQGVQLVAQRWQNLVTESGLAIVAAVLHCGMLWAFVKGRFSSRFLPLALVALFLLDTGRINDKFMFLVNVPEKVKGVRTPLIDYLANNLKGDEYRVLPLDGSDPMELASNKIPVMFTSNPVQQRRWQDFLDNFTLDSAMPDMINLKYLLLGKEQFQKEGGQFGNRYRLVYESPDGRVVLENTTVLPKGWLVPNVTVMQDSQQALTLMQTPVFDPRYLATVESPPPIPLAGNDQAMDSAGSVTVKEYGGNRILLAVDAKRNALLVVGEKYNKWWQTAVDGKGTPTWPVNHVLRGVYIQQGQHMVEMKFAPLPFTIGRYLTLVSMMLFAFMLMREIWLSKKRARIEV